MKKRNKIILLLSTYFIILFAPKSNSKHSIEYNQNYTYQSCEPYGYYKGKRIYISDGYTINELLNSDDTSIYIIDERTIFNPDISIYNSYKIHNNDEKFAIINAILQYEKEYPSPWERKASSMKNEWDIHNICYELGIDRNSTDSIDFDNDDASIYDSKILSLFLRN